MFSHIFIGINDFEKALAFFEPLADALGLNLRFSDAEGNKLCVVCDVPETSA